MINLYDNRTIETDIYYKTTNTHDYLRYDSDHPMHIKNNVPFNLAKRIKVFCTDEATERKRLLELRTWLENSGYPKKVINRGFKNASLHGPANRPMNNQITFITTHASNYDPKHVTQKAQNLISECRNEKLKEIFRDNKVTLALKQPPNLLRILTRANFSFTGDEKLPNGLFKCHGARCLLCKYYIQECSYFYTSNNVKWDIKEHITCQSINVLYYLKCIICNYDTYTGKTNIYRPRMNNHISECRTGNSSDKFDIHVFNCRKKHNYNTEPYFKIFAFMTVPHESMLATYEKFLHDKGFDTLN